MHGNVFQSPGGQGSDPGQQPYQNAIYYFNDRSPDVAAIYCWWKLLVIQGAVPWLVATLDSESRAMNVYMSTGKLNIRWTVFRSVFVKHFLCMTGNVKVQ